MPYLDHIVLWWSRLTYIFFKPLGTVQRIEIGLEVKFNSYIHNNCNVEKCIGIHSDKLKNVKFPLIVK